jgi:hypothetical protein
MHPGVLLLVCLLSLYLAAMVIFWQCLRGHKREEPLETEGRFTLREGQTILGVMDTTERICFCIGKMEDHVHHEEDGGQ